MASVDMVAISIAERLLGMVGHDFVRSWCELSILDREALANVQN